MKKIHLRLTGILVLVIFLFTGVFFFVSYARARDSLTARLERDYSAEAEKYARELSAWVDTHAALVDSLAAEITVSGIYAEGYDAFHAFLADTCRLLDRGDVIYDIYFTYPDNTMACASSFTADGSVDYVHDRDWFTRAAGTGELFYSTPYRDSDSGKPVFTISRGVYADNVLQGVLAADIFVDVLVDTIREADVAPDSYAFLVDQNLGMVVHPNDAYAYDDVPRGVLDVRDAAYDDVVSKVRSGSRETVYVEDYDGVSRGVVVSKMANTGWYVGIATARSQLNGDTDSLFIGMLIAGAAAIAIGGGAAVFLSHLLDRRAQRPAENPAAAPVHEERKPAPRSGDREIPARSLFSRFLPIVLTFLLMTGMVFYTTRTIRNVSAANIREVGEDRIASAAAELENYLGTAKSTLWVTADTAAHMIRSGATAGDVLEYITEETENQKAHFDVNITGLYGYVLGEYIDGLGWTPPENYDPTRRDWYLSALAAGGEAVIVAPYVDAQTDDMVISIARMLPDSADVISVDFTMNRIQEIVSSLQVKEKGYAFIVDRDGRLIAHRDVSRQGRFLTEEEGNLALFDMIRSVENGNFDILADGRASTAFVRRITDQWYAVIVIGNAELMTEVQQQLVINVLICVIIFALITFFFLLGHKTEKNYSGRIQQMRAAEQQRAYEARALKLEKEAADRASQAKSDFLASMSHEIRTPINAVLGMNEMILRETYSMQHADPDHLRQSASRIRDCAGNIASAGSSLLSVVNGVLDFSKIEAGKMEIASDAYSLRAVLSDVCGLVAFRARDKGLAFSAEVSPSLPDRLVGDPVRLRQVLANLLSNAVKYTDRGSVLLSVCGEEEKEQWNPGDTVRLLFAVRDTGIGIREEDLPRLFDRFQRLDLEKTGTVEGTGMGLAIVRQLLSLLHGEIRVESVYGRGSVFTVLLPQPVAAGDPVGDFHPDAEAALPDPDSCHESFRAPEARLLVVDDTRMNLTVAAGLLEPTGIRIDTALRGEDAVRAAAATAYDLILMDQRMPGMDGLEALRRIRETPSGLSREAPVICMTADAVRGARERYLAEGFTDYLSKPLDFRTLERTLLRYLPASKVILSDIPVPEAEVHTDDDEFAPLRAAGLRVEEGLAFCQSSPDLYRTILGEYCLAAAEKQPLLSQYYRLEDWPNYRILVHSLKSTSRTVGAAALAEDAALLESASASPDLETLRRVHPRVMRRWAEVAEAVSAFLGPRESPPSGPVLEFPPEEP